jgi:hypothetical protein
MIEKSMLSHANSYWKIQVDNRNKILALGVIGSIGLLYCGKLNSGLFFLTAFASCIICLINAFDALMSIGVKYVLVVVVAVIFASISILYGFSARSLISHANVVFSFLTTAGIFASAWYVATRRAF